MIINYPRPILPMIDSTIGALLEDFGTCRSKPIVDPDEMVKEFGIFLSAIGSLLVKLDTLLDQITKSTDPIDEKARQNPFFKSDYQNLENQLNEEKLGNPSILEAAKSGNLKEIATDILYDDKMGNPIENALSTFLADFPPTRMGLV